MYKSSSVSAYKMILWYDVQAVFGTVRDRHEHVAPAPEPMGSGCLTGVMQCARSPRGLTTVRGARWLCCLARVKLCWTLMVMTLSIEYL